MKRKKRVSLAHSLFRQFSLTGQFLWKCPTDAHTTKMSNFWLAKSPKQPQVLCPLKDSSVSWSHHKAQWQFHFIQLTGTAMYPQDSTYVLQLSDNFQSQLAYFRWKSFSCTFKSMSRKCWKATSECSASSDFLGSYNCLSCPWSSTGSIIFVPKSC